MINSPLYRLSLDRNPNVFDTSKFLEDPWKGDISRGQSLSDYEYSKLDSHFSWIRDLQVLGGHNARKLARTFILKFIDSYRKRKNYWNNKDSWDLAIVSERVVNLILSYSFYASGANEKFQKEVMSSIAEQFSHISKCQDSENSPYKKLIILKALFFCNCVMKHPSKRRIRKILSEIYFNIEQLASQFKSRGIDSPVAYFHTLRSILEIRFIGTSAGVDLKHVFLNPIISMMVSNLRLLRLGDGMISNINFDIKKSLFEAPSRYMVDSVFSISNNKALSQGVFGFKRIASKNISFLINTLPRKQKSMFNRVNEPGINIFDFEGSFGDKRILLRSDISVLFNGYRLKVGDQVHISKKVERLNDKEIFEGETQLVNRFFKFAMRRELSVFLERNIVSGTDFTLITGEAESYFRFVFHKDSEIRRLSMNRAVITLNNTDFLFHISSENDFLMIIDDQDVEFPGINVLVKKSDSSQVEVNWTIEEVVS